MFSHRVMQPTFIPGISSVCFVLARTHIEPSVEYSGILGLEICCRSINSEVYQPQHRFDSEETIASLTLTKGEQSDGLAEANNWSSEVVRRTQTKED